MTKIPEGLYNKMFFLKMENGREVLGRIPNPNAGHPQLVVASEVATLDFVSEIPLLLLFSPLALSPLGWADFRCSNHMQLHNVLDIPVLRVLS
jgi:hypothetical protein